MTLVTTLKLLIIVNLLLFINGVYILLLTLLAIVLPDLVEKIRDP